MHGLTNTNGRIEMAYVGDTPWHGLGQSLKKDASIEEWILAAGMNWKVQRSKVRFFTERDGSTQAEWPDHNVLFRSDTKAPLGLVSKKFKVVQPQATLEFFRDLLHDAGFSIVTAGTMFGGRRFWALAHVGQNAKVLSPKDVVGGYLLICTAVDGTLETIVKFTTICVVCNNTLNMALRNAEKREVKVSHRSHFDASAVKVQLGVAQGDFQEFMYGMRALAGKRITQGAADTLTRALLVPTREPVHTLLSLKEQAELAEKTRASRNYTSIMELFNGRGLGSDLSGRAGTAWGWVNAVTEHVDYRARTLTLDSRLDSAWFGKGDALKTRAVELARDLA